MSQPLPLREQMKALESLQELDLKIDSLKKKRDALPAELKALNETFAKAKAAIDAKNNAIVEIEKVQRQTKAAIELNADRVTRSSSKLEGVKNSTEFQAASKELEQLRKLTLTLEDQVKKNDLDIKTAQDELAKLNEQFEKVNSDHGTQSSEISAQKSKIEDEIQHIVGQRTQYTNNIESRTLALYDRVRVARSGLGVVHAIGGRCKGCNMMVPPQLYNEIQRGTQVHSCPSCHRILLMPVTGGPAAHQ